MFVGLGIKKKLCFTTTNLQQLILMKILKKCGGVLQWKIWTMKRLRNIWRNRCVDQKNQIFKTYILKLYIKYFLGYKFHAR